MFIQIQETPNPDSLMFVPGRDVSRDTVFFKKTDVCTSSPFARRLLDVAGVTNVFLGRDFITITKEPAFDWFILKPYVLGIIMEQFVKGDPVILNDGQVDTMSDMAMDDSLTEPLTQQIRAIIEEKVRPAVAADGGDICFHHFNKGIVYVELKGACSGCPSASVTLQSGIENMLKYYVPEVIAVKDIHEVETID